MQRTTPPGPARRPSGVVLTGLLLGTFVAGSAEVLTVGLLPLISRGLEVSTAAGPIAVVITAVIIALGALALAVATRRLEPPRVPPFAARTVPEEVAV